MDGHSLPQLHPTLRGLIFELNPEQKIRGRKAQALLRKQVRCVFLPEVPPFLK